MIKTALLAAAAVAAVAAVPASALTYAFTYTSTSATAPFLATGLLTTANGLNGVGGYDITAISGNVDGDAITALTPNPTQPNASFSADGLFIYDNVLFPTSDPVLSNPGVLFTSAGGFEYNLFSTGPGAYALYQAIPGVGYVTNSTGTLALAFVPEPATWGLMIVGFGLIGVAARRKPVVVAA